MSSTSTSAVASVLKKEWRSEIRSPHASLTALLFSVLAVVALTLATYNVKLGATEIAGLIWVVFIFSSVTAIPRTFIAEEEIGTGDILRMIADPHVVYWGKAVFNLVQTIIINFFLAFLLLIFVGGQLHYFSILILSLVAGSVALTGAVTLSGALASRAANRQALAGAVALPFLIPIAAWGVASLQVALGEGSASSGYRAAFGLFAYGLMSLMIGPFIYAGLWKS